MRNLNLFFLIIINLIISACNNNQTIQGDTSFLDLEVPVYDFQNVKMSDIISEYEIVPLEFTNKSMISGIFKIIIHDDLIYILDCFGAQSILVFDMKGNFKRSISRKGNGPGEITYPMDFEIIPEENRIDVLGYKMIKSFSLQGSLIKESSYDFSSTGFKKLGETYYFEAPYKTDCLLYRTDENFKFKGFSLVRKKRDVSGTIVYSPFLQTNPNYITYWALANDTIYKIDEKKSYPFRAINYGKYTYDHDDYASLSVEEKARLMMFNRDNIEKCLLNKYFETDKYIEINYVIKGKHCVFIYNKETKLSMHYDQKHLTDDITGLNLHGKIPALIGCDKERFYFMVAPYNYKSTEPLLRFMNGASNKKVYTLDDVKKISNNPIIVFAKYDF
ncbi:6-bladed beta-propeller [Maribellus comscasis]|uniref:6-bladed beta-propeller n=1 Tax=Maribellus comscasis TaxID=2681766 RepID=A0A6I6K2N2_9BACT|nr:6-bladed beta-propeller [Maribellus comscasis]QGY47919.1 6-bladed beta-propeller [Maribellus comscasis]